MSSSRLLLIGIGNRDRGDDAIGPLLAERIIEKGLLKGKGVEIIIHSGEGASLIELWSNAEKVVIVDAMKSDAKVGEIRCFDIAKDSLKGGTFHYSSHLFGLAEAVELARQLKRLPRSMIIYGIEGRNFSFGAQLSPEVSKSLENLEELVVKQFFLDLGYSGTP